MTYQLRMMKEEGALSPHRTNLATLEEFSKNLRTSVSILDPQARNWNPPAWELFQKPATLLFPISIRIPVFQDVSTANKFAIARRKRKLDQRS